MVRRPIHEIKLRHDWGTPVSYESTRNSYKTVKTCKDCGTRQQTLHLFTVAESDFTLSRSINTCTEPEKKQAFTELKDAIQGICDGLNQMERDIFSGTVLSGWTDFASRMNKEYEGTISDEDITPQLAKLYLRVSGKKSRRKILLALKQGLVCNRCDHIYPFDQLTQDEIEPKSRGGQAKLTNLQLLCSPCNGEKDSNAPGPRDRSPFTNEQPPCIHQVQCTDIA